MIFPSNNPTVAKFRGMFGVSGYNNFSDLVDRGFECVSNLLTS
jgi:hypothetical protein